MRLKQAGLQKIQSPIKDRMSPILSLSANLLQNYSTTPKLRHKKFPAQHWLKKPWIYHPSTFIGKQPKPEGDHYHPPGHCFSSSLPVRHRAGNYLRQTNADIKEHEKASDFCLCEAFILNQKTREHCQGNSVSSTIKNNTAEQSNSPWTSKKLFGVFFIIGIIKRDNRCLCFVNCRRNKKNACDPKMANNKKDSFSPHIRQL